MSVITVATSKGGAGKTTLAEVILGTSVERGYSVAAIDADYNHTLSDWVRTFAKYPIDMHAELDETKLVGLVEELERQHDVVVIDTAGAATQATVFAIGCADLVLVPVQLSSADVIEAIKTAGLVKSASQLMRRDITMRVVLTDYQPYTNIGEHILAELEKHELPLMPTKLHRLVAFKEMTFTGHVPDRGTAGSQIDFLMDEVVALAGVPTLKTKLAS
ncbi:division plane positioning ATPase MipZ [Microbaculum sp. FT89]|uniref:division plane positioning ATPase MipZ n=1 Tax=Microbaculum sp. FT89 TaxID=3447298 RepID=UPI003F52A4C6